jgi:hypothetical protein
MTMMFKLTRKTKKPKRSSIVMRSAQGRQTFTSTRMPGSVRRQVRASFEEASRSVR